jgi:hypothetical protein
MLSLIAAWVRHHDIEHRMLAAPCQRDQVIQHELPRIDLFMAEVAAAVIASVDHAAVDPLNHAGAPFAGTPRCSIDTHQF